MSELKLGKTIEVVSTIHNYINIRNYKYCESIFIYVSVENFLMKILGHRITPRPFSTTHL